MELDDLCACTVRFAISLFLLFKLYSSHAGLFLPDSRCAETVLRVYILRARLRNHRHGEVPAVVLALVQGTFEGVYKLDRFFMYIVGSYHCK